MRGWQMRVIRRPDKWLGRSRGAQLRACIHLGALIRGALESERAVARNEISGAHEQRVIDKDLALGGRLGARVRQLARSLGRQLSGGAPQRARAVAATSWRRLRERAVKTLGRS